MPFDTNNDWRQAVALWCHEQATAVVNAVTLVAGERSGSAVHDLLGEIASSERLNRRHLVRLDQVRGILMLDDPSSLFGPSIDPADSRIDEVCLLAESLDDLLGNIGRRMAA